MKCKNCERAAAREAEMLRGLSAILLSLGRIEAALLPEPPIIAETPEQEVALRNITRTTVH